MTKILAEIVRIKECGEMTLKVSFPLSQCIILQNTEQGKNNNIFKALWSLNIIPRATHLGWRVFLDRISTKVNLVKKGIGLSNKLCEICKKEEKTSCHLFLTVNYLNNYGIGVIVG